MEGAVILALIALAAVILTLWVLSWDNANGEGPDGRCSDCGCDVEPGDGLCTDCAWWKAIK